MSRHEQKQDTIVRPAGTRSDLQTGLRQAWKPGAATDFHAALDGKGTDRPDFDWTVGPARLAEPHRTATDRQGDEDTASIDREAPPEVAGSIPPRSGPSAPKARDLPDTDAATRRFDPAEAAIALDGRRRTVAWSMRGNNHAIRHARAHPMARILFGARDGIGWTRSSGGTIGGIDEYHAKGTGEGKGANRINQRFGLAGENRGMAQSTRHAAARRPARRGDTRPIPL